MFMKIVAYERLHEMIELARKPEGLRHIRHSFIAVWNRRGLGIKAFSFGLIGVLSTVVDFSIFWLAIIAGGLPLIPANLLAWLVAVSGSYVMNSLTTFAAESGRELTLWAYLRFMASGVLGFLANSVVLVIAALYLNVLPAKLLAIGISFVVNFSMSHFFVFRVRPPKA